MLERKSVGYVLKVSAGLVLYAVGITVVLGDTVSPRTAFAVIATWSFISTAGWLIAAFKP